ncbi:MAG: Fis family transcriptional regulator [Deltaproteobacteria bacterium]|nr:sigma 54-interacting transcriptional regulator [Deltaproteobacteria bacterium]RLA89301.1 MAG: Fis family transcriptional regulator [Deltaproteobacteria bacterium]
MKRVNQPNKEDQFYGKFKLTLNSIPCGIIILNKKDEVILINQEALDIIGLNHKVLTPPFKASKEFPEELVRAFRESCIEYQEIKVNNHLLTLKRFNFEDHGVNWVLYLLENQTIIKQLLKEFEIFKEYSLDLETIFNESFDVIYVSDGDGNTLRVSSACERLWGVKAEDLVGRNVRDLEKEGIFNPSITRLVLEKRQKVSAFQTTRNNRRLFVVGTPIFNEEGNIIRVVNASRDITELNMLQKELENLKQLSQRYQQELLELRSKEFRSGRVVFRSDNMKQLLSFIYRIAPVDTTVLITGESGVGKEVIAREIHRLSDRKNNPFIKINCGTIPESLLESELFGYEKGAFTGARSQGKPGLIELADTGTLFLDEIAELSLVLQGKLLQVIQEKEFIPIGGINPIKVNVRILAATNKNLVSLVEQGKFREDMYYRLNVISLTIPPLRDRIDDILPLAQHFLQRFNKRYFQNKRFSPRVLDAFVAYSWPGNVRELENTVERLVVTVESQLIELEHLPENIYRNNYLDQRARIDFKEVIPLKEAIDLTEAKLLTLAMKQYKTTIAAAKALRVNQSTISRKLKKIGWNK